MTELLDDVRKEIVNLHDFFVAWFNGTADRSQLDAEFVARMDPNVTFIPPEGITLSMAELVNGFQQAHGTNKEFRIEIRDVAIRHVVGNHILVTYTEWQRGAVMSSPSQNARQSSGLLTKNRPFRWLHIQETWMPEGVRAAGSFEF
jgi:hypothetical protein